MAEAAANILGGGAPPAASSSPPAAPAATPTPAPSIWDGADADLMQHILGKGWKTPTDAARAHLHAQQKISWPEDRVLKLPSAADDPSWGEVFNKLGRPEKADGYDFGDAKPVDGAPDLISPFRAKAHEVGLSQAQARSILEWYDGTAGELAKIAEQRQAENEARFAEERTAAVNKAFGAKAPEAILAQKAACEKFGISDELLENIVDGLGHLPMEDATKAALGLFSSLAQVGMALGEHRTPAGSGPGLFPGSPDYAKAEISKLEADPAFMRAYNKGEEWAVKRRTELFAQAYPEKRS